VHDHGDGEDHSHGEAGSTHIHKAQSTPSQSEIETVAVSPPSAVEDLIDKDDQRAPHTHSKSAEPDSKLKIKFFVELYTLLAGVTFHSVFVGFAIGIEESLSLCIA
jgi:hypothetical protein